MKVRQEPENLPRKHVLAATLGAVVLTAFGVFVAWQLGARRAHDLGSASPSPSVAPVPSEVNHIEMGLFDERHTMRPIPRTRAHLELERWSWADEERRVVRPPIDTAIDIYLSEKKGALSHESPKETP